LTPDLAPKAILTTSSLPREKGHRRRKGKKREVEVSTRSIQLREPLRSPSCPAGKKSNLSSGKGKKRGRTSLEGKSAFRGGPSISSRSLKKFRLKGTGADLSLWTPSLKERGDSPTKGRRERREGNLNTGRGRSARARHGY